MQLAFTYYYVILTEECYTLSQKVLYDKMFRFT